MAEQLEERCIERHLYRRKYRTVTGRINTVYLGVFRDWKGKRRKYSLGSDLKYARKRLTRLLGQNEEQKDFDNEKAPGMTFSAWAERYLDLVRNKESLERDVRSCKRLKAFFGKMPLSQITRAQVMEYKNIRLEDPIVRRGRPVDGSKLKVSTINRELACLRHVLKLAEDEGLIEAAPRVKLDSEKKFARKRVVKPAEYGALQEASPRYLQRVLIGFYETAMRRSELLKLTWDRVDERAGVIRLRPEDTKEDDSRTIPISPELGTVLAELKAEQKKVIRLRPEDTKEDDYLVNRVFTRAGQPIKSIRTIFEKAKKRARIENLVIHDFRHTAITNWISQGIPQEAVMAASGHKSLAMHYRYVNLQEDHLKEAFRKVTHIAHTARPVDSPAAVSY